MRLQVKEHRVFTEINGFRGVQIDSAKILSDLANQEKKRNTTVQFLDAQHIATWEHLYFALLNALLAFKHSNNISRSLGVEIMLYASAQRQIRRAIDLVGVKRGYSNLAVVIVGVSEADVKLSLNRIVELIGKAQDESVLELSGGKAKEIQRIFEITDAEIVAIPQAIVNRALLDLVIERMALLVTQI